MEVTNTQSAAATPVRTGNEQAAAVLSSDFETFLQMLTAQAKYQDPLEPIDSSEYAAQLAQFSMVEQQVLSNDLLTALTNAFSAGNIGQAASWIGMEARTTAPVQFDGTPLTVLPLPESTAEEAVLVVKDADGNEVQRRQIATTNDPIEWDGIGNDGTILDPGVYSFSVESSTAGQLIGTSQAETYARITEAQRQAGDTVYVLQGGSVVTAEDVTALREPEPAAASI